MVTSSPEAAVCQTMTAAGRSAETALRWPERVGAVGNGVQVAAPSVDTKIRLDSVPAVYCRPSQAAATPVGLHSVISPLALPQRRDCAATTALPSRVVHT